jgi:hypothetical protein
MLLSRCLRKIKNPTELFAVQFGIYVWLALVDSIHSMNTSGITSRMLKNSSESFDEAQDEREKF